MARRARNGLNKSELIRSHAASGITSAKEIASKMQAEGIKVSMPQIYTILAKTRKAPKRRGGRPKKVSPAATSAPARNGTGISLQDLTTLAELAKRAGGVSQLRAFLDTMATLA